MKLYLTEKALSIRETLNIYDADRTVLYQVQNKIVSWGTHLVIQSRSSKATVGEVKEKHLRLKETYQICAKGSEDITLKEKTFSLFRKKWHVPEKGWTIKGALLTDNLIIEDETGESICKVKKKWLSWSETYEIDCQLDGVELLQVIGVVLAMGLLRSAESTTTDDQ